MPPVANKADLVVTTTPVASVALRRLTTKERFAAALGFTPTSAENTEIDILIDRACELLARECGLIETAGGERPTFGNERLTATWLACGYYRGPELWLPWRVPVSGITSVVEDGVALATSTNYLLTNSTPGCLLRVDDDLPTPWSSAKIVVVFNAGWDLSSAANVPPVVEQAVTEQIRAAWSARKRDPAIKSAAVPDVATVSYALSGGEMMGKEALLPQVLAAMAPYWNPAR